MRCASPSRPGSSWPSSTRAPVQPARACTGFFRGWTIPMSRPTTTAASAPNPRCLDGLGQRIASVHGYRAQSYTLALSIALEHLGCDAALHGIHVGT